MSSENKASTATTTATTTTTTPAASTATATAAAAVVVDTTPAGCQKVDYNQGRQCRSCWTRPLPAGSPAPDTCPICDRPGTYGYEAEIAAAPAATTAATATVAK